MTLLMAVLMLLGALSSCGDQPENQSASSELPGSESPEPASEPETEPDTEPATEPEEPLPIPDKPVYEYEYTAPEDGSFTICGIPLSEYTLVMYFPTSSDYSLMNRKVFLSRLESPISSATEEEWKVTTVKNEKCDTE